MECLGGNGYVEEQGEGVMARIYREMPLNSIWEGAGNIMALDLLRALRMPRTWPRRCSRRSAPARGAHPALDRAAERALAGIDTLADEAQARRLARDIALLLQAALLQRGSAAVFSAFCASRLDGSGRCLRPAAGRHRLRRDPAVARCPRCIEGTTMSELILHHYANSPFSEKVRLVLGLKGLSWRSVTVPVMMPKPDVLALTGGYRRTPFMQIGADIYCDSALMCRVHRPAGAAAAAVPGQLQRHGAGARAVGRHRRCSGRRCR